MSEGEQVLAVPRDLVVEGEGWHGVRTVGLDGIDALVARAGRFVERSLAETDETLKQVIPYLVLRDGERYFLMRRTRAGGDARLHERASIGVGGHLNPGDGDVHGALLREWREEVRADFIPAFRAVGLLNDDSNAVGRVHVGVVYEADAEGRPVTVREVEKLTGGFATREEVEAAREQLETWSALVFDFLEGRERGRVGGR